MKEKLEKYINTLYNELRDSKVPYFLLCRKWGIVK